MNPTPALPTHELRETTGATFTNDASQARPESLTCRQVADAAFKSAFSDVIAGTTQAASLF